MFINPISSSSYVSLPQSTLRRAQRKNNKTISTGIEKKMILYYFLSFIHHPTRNLMFITELQNNQGFRSYRSRFSGVSKVTGTFLIGKKLKQKSRKSRGRWLRQAQGCCCQVPRRLQCPSWNVEKLKRKKLKCKKTEM